MQKYLEKRVRKYVLATLDTPTMYLKKTPSKSEYSFVDNIEIATKSKTKSVINQVLKYFYTDTKLTHIKLVPIPIDITYEIVEE